MKKELKKEVRTKKEDTDRKRVRAWETESKRK
jgi:hypothetical protein